MPDNRVRIRTDCRICAAPLEHELIAFPSLPVAGTYVREEDSASPPPLAPLTLIRCRTCGLVQLKESLTNEFYRNYRFAGGTAAGYRGYLKKIKKQISTVLPSGSSIIEIGCGDGTLLSLLKERGYQVAGFEPAAKPAELCRRKGVDTVCLPLSAQSATQSPIATGDLIIVRHVMEHIDDFESFFSGIARLSSAESILFIEIPDMQATVASKIFDNIYHPHVCYFDTATIQLLLHRFGWEIAKYGQVEIFGGSILLTACRDKGPVSPASKLVLGAETLPLHEEDLARFCLDFHYFAKETYSFFDSMSRKGTRIAGYGAAERTTALMGMIGLRGEHLACIYDRNPSLHGLSIPGSNVKIKSPDELLTDMPEILVMFARSHEDEIMSQLEEYRKKGGTFASLRTTPPSLIV